MTERTLLFNLKGIKAMKIDNWILVVRRLRETTGASWITVKDYLIRKNYWPLTVRQNYVKFVNNSFVQNWTKRP